MGERIEYARYASQFQAAEQKKPLDVKLVELGKKGDVIQGIGGTALLLSPLTFGVGAILLTALPVEYVLKKRYIDWRMKGRQTQLQAA